MGAESKLKTFLLYNAIYIVLGTIIVVLVAVNPALLSKTNISYILSQASPRIILALAMGGLLVLGGTDLSAGSMVGMSGLICASLLQAPNYTLRLFPDMPILPVIIPLLLVVVLSSIITVGHSLLISKLKIAPFIASLGVQLIVYGLISLYNDFLNKMSPVSGLDVRYTNFAQGAFSIFGFRVAYIFVYALITSSIVWLIWNKTTLGKKMFAVGGNAEAATVSGISVVRIYIWVYLIAGILYGFSGFLEAARTGSATNGMGAGYHLDAIAACVVGGLSMRGGVGKVSGIIVGVFIFQMINYGLVFMGVNPFIQFVVKGIIIIFAITIDTQKYIKKR